MTDLIPGFYAESSLDADHSEYGVIFRHYNIYVMIEPAFLSCNKCESDHGPLY